MIYYTYDYNYMYTGSVDSLVTVTSSTTVAPLDNTYILYNSTTDAWEQIITTLTIGEYITKELINARSYFEDLINANTTYVADFETATYQTQENEWKLYIADNLAPTPYVDGLSAARGVAKADLMTKIGDKIAYFATVQGTLHMYQDQINACLAIADLDALVLPWRP